MTIPAIPGQTGAPTIPPELATIVTPAGNSQATVAQLSYGLNLIDVTVQTGGLALPLAVAGAQVWLVNFTTNGGSVEWYTQHLYAMDGTSDTINGQAHNIDFDVLAAITGFACVVDGEWLGNVNVD